MGIHRIAAWFMLIAAPLPAMAAQWSELGGSATGGGISNSPGDQSSYPALACDASGFPIVAWGERGKILLKRWNGIAWVGMGGSEGGAVSIGATSSSKPSLAIDSAGNPVVAWRGAFGTQYYIFVQRWNGSAWASFGATGGWIETTGVQASYPSLALDSSDRPVVAWEEQDDTYNTQIRLMRWDGAAWTPQDGVASALGVSNAGWSAKRPSMALTPSGLPIVAYENCEVSDTDKRIFVRTWDAATSMWTGIGGSDSPGGISAEWTISAQPALVIDPAGRPVVAWISQLGFMQIYVKTWDGTAWVGFGNSGTGTGFGGITQYNSINRAVAITLDAAGLPTVSWMTPYSPAPHVIVMEIHLLRFSNGTWNEVDGSATGTGVSNSTTSCGNSTLVFNPHGELFVAWDGAIGNGEVSLRAQMAPLPVFDSAPGQVRLDGITPIPVGGLRVEDGFVAVIPASDPQGRTVQLDLEVRPVGSPFTGIATASGPPVPANSTLTLSATGLALDQAYHWQVRMRLGTRELPWFSFGANPEIDPDIRLRSNAAPQVTQLKQFSALVPHPVVAGGRLIGDDGVVFSGFIVDADGDDVGLEVEALPVDSPFSGAFLIASSRVTSGNVVSATARLARGPHHWRARAVDAFDVPSPWITFGGNADGEADFLYYILGGSIGTTTKCLQSATADGAWGFALVLALLAAASRRRGLTPPCAPCDA